MSFSSEDLSNAAYLLIPGGFVSLVLLMIVFRRKLGRFGGQGADVALDEDPCDPHGIGNASAPGPGNAYGALVGPTFDDHHFDVH